MRRRQTVLGGYRRGQLRWIAGQVQSLPASPSPGNGQHGAHSSREQNGLPDRRASHWRYFTGESQTQPVEASKPVMVRVQILLRAPHAAVVQRQNTCLPSRGRGFDSRRPLQKSRPALQRRTAPKGFSLDPFIITQRKGKINDQPCNGQNPR